MIFSEPTMLCDVPEQASCPGGSRCCVFFEAPTLPSLGQQLAQWLQMHQGYAPVAFSHAQETRWEPRASLAGPQACSLYTGLLLLRVPPERHTEQEESQPTEQIPQGGEDLHGQIEQLLRGKDRL